MWSFIPPIKLFGINLKVEEKKNLLGIGFR